MNEGGARVAISGLAILLAGNLILCSTTSPQVTRTVPQLMASFCFMGSLLVLIIGAWHLLTLLTTTE